MTDAASDSTDPATFRRMVKSEREALVAALERAGENRAEEPGVAGAWSCKDLLGHCLFWDTQAMTNLGLLAEGRADEIARPESLAEVDEWNAREAAARRDSPFRQLLAEYAQLSIQIDARLLGTSPEELETTVGGRRVAELVAVDTYEHYREHRQQIEAWLARHQEAL